MPTRSTKRIAQAWVSLAADDPEAVSAHAVARAHLAAGARLAGLRRFRLFELRGKLPPPGRLAELLHHSSQFYNPHKERCAVRAAERERPPLAETERAVLVTERNGTRRPAAERWWRHETGEAIEVHEGVVWVLAFEPGVDADPLAEDLAVVRDRRHGLLANPLAQDARVGGTVVPMPWIGDTGESRRTVRRSRHR